MFPEGPLTGLPGQSAGWLGGWDGPLQSFRACVLLCVMCSGGVATGVSRLKNLDILLRGDRAMFQVYNIPWYGFMRFTEIHGLGFLKN